MLRRAASSTVGAGAVGPQASVDRRRGPQAGQQVVVEVGPERHRRELIERYEGQAVGATAVRRRPGYIPAEFAVAVAVDHVG